MYPKFFLYITLQIYKCWMNIHHQDYFMSSKLIPLQIRVTETATSNLLSCSQFTITWSLFIFLRYSKKNPNFAISVAKRDWNSKKRCIKNTTMLAYVLTFKYMHASPQKKRGKTEIPQIHHRDARYIQTRVPKKKTINF